MSKQLSLWKSVHVTKAGHLRYHAPAELRWKYVHRVLVERMVEETPWSVRLLLPLPYEVHHIDFNKQHNCHCNFLLLSEAFHSVLTAAGIRRADNGKFRPRWKVESVIPNWKEGDLPF